ncbi:hypothetical protein GGS23DRAFT_548528 [Durotheca rogersii]|uniref:uncharacterized protein n=1 Tax=Durotheca rogersii TaxID=419775 RepID=UPI00221E6E2D|nr:uncharacterized protein GGS23DRAFT_548528 [Durotheca rogersii]KAI5867469.1 hypothetical protein GGS23DRAFT_548528 [Durotheca rogersii]
MGLSAQKNQPKGGRGDPAGPRWSSGRGLTESQRARKREVDRIRSRRCRQSTLARIAELETKLQRVLAAEPDGRREPKDSPNNRDEIPNGTQNQITNDAQVQGNDTAAPRSFNRDPKRRLDEDAAGWGFLSLPEDSTNTSQLAMKWGSEYRIPTQNGHHDPQDELTMHPSHPPDLPGVNLGTVAQASNLVLSRGPALGSDIIRALFTTSALRSTARTLEHVQQFHKAAVCTDDRLNQDVLICAVTEGWDAAESRGKLCPLWKILRLSDRLIFQRSSQVTRLVMLRMIHHMLLFKVCRRRLDQLPPWYRPRPTQTMFAHDGIIDFFVWPGMRERLVLSKANQLTNDFWECFSRNFRFLWPYPFEDIYALDFSTGRFYFSALFEKQLLELTTWQMERQFFLSFPEFGDDIKVAEPHCSEFSVRPCAMQRSFREVECSEGAGAVGFGDHVPDFDIGTMVPQEIPGQVCCGLTSFDTSSYESSCLF